MPKLTLSFDNGPVPGATERILEILAERGLKASFFLIGERLRDPACRRLAERAKDEGHWIGNHTMTHTAPLTQLSDPNHAETEIGRCQEMLGALSHPMRFFRPSGGGTLGPHLLTRSAVGRCRIYRDIHRCHAVDSSTGNDGVSRFPAQ